jgi:hypothetical protein
MTVSLWIRETVGGKRRFLKVNKKKNYPEGTVFCLRFAAEGKRRWETLSVNSLTAALAARATKEATLLSEVPTTASAPAKRVSVDDATATYLTTVEATRSHKTWLAYSLVFHALRAQRTMKRVPGIELVLVTRAFYRLKLQQAVGEVV